MYHAYHGNSPVEFFYLYPNKAQLFSFCSPLTIIRAFAGLQRDTLLVESF